MNKQTRFRASAVYALVALVLACVTVFYVGVTLLSNPGLISIEKIYYMLNDFNISAISLGEDFSSVSRKLVNLSLQ